MAAIAAIIAAGASVAGGVMAKQSADKQASLQRQQAEIQKAEAMRAAKQKEEEVRKFKARQKMAFIKSGVTLMGTPTLVLDETQNKGDEEVRAIINRGYAQYQLGMSTADITKNEGRAALIGGIGSAAGTVAGGAFKMSD